MRCVHSKKTLGYRGRKTYLAAAKREENQRETRGETNPQTNNQCFPMRRRKEPMEEQNRINEENNPDCILQFSKFTLDNQG